MSPRSSTYATESWLVPETFSFAAISHHVVIRFVQLECTSVAGNVLPNVAVGVRRTEWTSPSSGVSSFSPGVIAYEVLPSICQCSIVIFSYAGPSKRFTITFPIIELKITTGTSIIEILVSTRTLTTDIWSTKEKTDTVTGILQTINTTIMVTP